MSEQFVLETRNLVKEFKGFVAVDKVNLQVRQGDIHALIGPNGAGKTTVFNLLTKFLSPTRGQILYHGEDITSLKSAAIARKGIVRSFQISAVFPHMTALENIRIALQTAEGTSFSFWKSGASLNRLNLSVVSKLCDRITVLAQGAVLTEGDYQAVLQTRECVKCTWAAMAAENAVARVPPCRRRQHNEPE